MPLDWRALLPAEGSDVKGFDRHTGRSFVKPNKNCLWSSRSGLQDRLLVCQRLDQVDHPTADCRVRDLHKGPGQLHTF